MRCFVHSAVIVLSMSFVPAVRAADWKVSKLRIVQVSSRDDLRRLCRFAGDLYACTVFESRSLATTCVASDASQWAILALASTQPVAYLWDGRYLGHEQLHISDIEIATRDYVERLGRHRYERESDCLNAAAAEENGFPRQIDLFAEASNARWH